MRLSDDSFEVGKWNDRRILRIDEVGEVEYAAEDSEAVAMAFERAAEKIRLAELEAGIG